MKRICRRSVTVLLAALVLAGCGQIPRADSAAVENLGPGAASASLTTLSAFGSSSSATEERTLLEPVASGTAVKKSTAAVIDYSNTADGYVMAKYTPSTQKRLKAQVRGPSGTVYTYDLTAGQWATFPLSDENGDYKVTVYENITGTKYAAVLSASFSAEMTDSFAPFLRPNQYVNYSAASKTVAKAAELTAGKADSLDKVKAVYGYVVTNFAYDKREAATVQSGYLPVLDTVLARKKGICFDYAAVMTAMLRSQGVPCKLVIGYADTVYHAWINVYSEETGWINGAIYFDGTDWKLMDPTFASSGKQSSSIMKYIADTRHYTAKYIY